LGNGTQILALNVDLGRLGLKFEHYKAIFCLHRFFFWQKALGNGTQILALNEEVQLLIKLNGNFFC